MIELICITCPKGCHLKVDETNDYKVTGNNCPRGEIYGKKELTNPTRVLTSTVKIESSLIRRLPVKTNTDIPKNNIMDVINELNNINLKTPVHIGDIIIENVLGLNANIVACKNVLK